MKRMCFAAVVTLTCAGWTVQAVAQTAISADGVVESTSGGFKFPDGTMQATAAAGGAPVEDTGLTQCFREDGFLRACTGTGEDGEFQAGVAWPTPRFTDNGDGTVTDNLTGLIWLKDANCPAGTPTWQLALDWVATFNGGSPACTNYTAGTFTDWRLPNIREFLSLVDYSQSNPALPSGHPFVSVQPSFYWSSSSFAFDPTGVWGVHMFTGDGSAASKANGDLVWPVRGGQ